MALFVKEPAEQYALTLDFSDQVPAGRTIVAAVLSVIDVSDESDATALVLVSPTGSVTAGAQVAMTVKGGIDGAQYVVTARALLDNGDTRALQVRMAVVDGLQTGFFVKLPVEQYDVAIDYADRLPAGRTISSATLTAKKLSDGSDVTALVLQSATGSVIGNQVAMKVKSGVDGEQYRIIVPASLDNGDLLQDDLTMAVIQQ